MFLFNLGIDSIENKILTIQLLNKLQKEKINFKILNKLIN